VTEVTWRNHVTTGLQLCQSLSVSSLWNSICLCQPHFDLGLLIDARPWWKTSPTFRTHLSSSSIDISFRLKMCSWVNAYTSKLRILNLGATDSKFPVLFPQNYSDLTSSEVAFVLWVTSVDNEVTSTFFQAISSTLTTLYISFGEKVLRKNHCDCYRAIKGELHNWNLQAFYSLNWYLLLAWVNTQISSNTSICNTQSRYPLGLNRLNHRFFLYTGRSSCCLGLRPTFKRYTDQPGCNS